MSTSGGARRESFLVVSSGKLAGHARATAPTGTAYEPLGLTVVEAPRDLLHRRPQPADDNARAICRFAWPRFFLHGSSRKQENSAGRPRGLSVRGGYRTCLDLPTPGWELSFVLDYPVVCLFLELPAFLGHKRPRLSTYSFRRVLFLQTYQRLSY